MTSHHILNGLTDYELARACIHHDDPIIQRLARIVEPLLCTSKEGGDAGEVAKALNDHLQSNVDDSCNCKEDALEDCISEVNAFFKTRPAVFAQVWP